MGLAVNTSRQGWRRVLGGVAAACLLAPALAVAHGTGEPSAHGHSERALQSFETKVLGPEHAREHALMRRMQARFGDSGAARRSAERFAADDGLTGLADLSRAGLGSAADLSAADADVDGQWSPPFDIPVMAIHAALLPTGKVLWFSYPTNPNPAQGGGPTVPNTAMAWLWDPAAGTGPAAFKRVDPPIDPRTGKPANIWCAGQMFLADGRVLVTGGNAAYPDPSAPVGQKDFKGLDKVYTFNPYNETWTVQPDMNHGRWYPSQVLLPDGRAVILDGYDETGGGPDSRNPEIELFTPAADGNPDAQGTTTLVTTRDDGPDTGPGPPFIGGGLYPHLAVMPSGRTMVFGPNGDDSWWFTHGGSFDWGETNTVPHKHLWGTGVLEPSADPAAPSERVMLIGGSDPIFAAPDPDYTATNRVETLDETPDFEDWQPASSLQIARSHQNTVLLPDGSMVTVGGGVGRDTTGNQWAGTDGQKQVELWDPVAKTWTLGAAQAELRTYHSTALLLPDARVVSAGDDYNGGISQDTAEIYEPPYLHTGTPRPTLTSAPASALLNQNFQVQTPDALVDRAVLIAPGATTHANDMSQRYVPLQIVSHVGDDLTLKAPSSGNVAPPGYYMLFLLKAGVPSVAKFIRLDANADAQAPFTYVTDGPPSASGSSAATLRFTSNEPGSTFSCRLDGGAATPCMSPHSYSGLPDGSHTFEVTATDGSGNPDPTPATYSWSIDTPSPSTDTTPPDTTITSGPAPATRAGDAEFSFGASEAGSAFACSLDGAPFAACSTPARYTGLADGNHSFSVRATDPLGNTDQSPAIRSWRIDRAAPRGSLRPRRGQRLRTALRKGIFETVSCTEACSISVDVLAEARLLRAPRSARLQRVVRKRARLSAPGRVTLKLRPDRRSRARLSRSKRVTFTIRATLTDALGNRRNLASKLRLR